MVKMISILIILKQLVSFVVVGMNWPRTRDVSRSTNGATECSTTNPITVEQGRIADGGGKVKAGRSVGVCS